MSDEKRTDLIYRLQKAVINPKITCFSENEKLLLEILDYLATPSAQAVASADAPATPSPTAYQITLTLQKTFRNMSREEALNSAFSNMRQLTRINHTIVPIEENR